MYLRKSDREFDPLAEKAIEKYSGQRERFTRSEVGSRTATPTAEVER